jgi:flavorubredoxin
MRAVVVYESHWGNTAEVARAIAEGIGPEAQALDTDEATAAAVREADLIVAGAPVMAFGLPGDRARAGLEQAASAAPTPPDTSHPSLRDWLAGLPAGRGAAAAFETRIRWSPGGATGAIERGLKSAGYRTVAKGQKFVVNGKYGPLRDGELAKARQWGRDLVATCGSSAAGPTT